MALHLLFLQHRQHLHLFRCSAISCPYSHLPTIVTIQLLQHLASMDRHGPLNGCRPDFCIHKQATYTRTRIYFYSYRFHGVFLSLFLSLPVNFPLLGHLGSA